jgi:hypothetical protein
MLIARGPLDAHVGIGRALDAGGDLVAVAERRVPLDVAAERPAVRESRAAVVGVEAARPGRLRDVHHQVRGAGRVGRGPEQARRGNAGQIVREQKPALHRLQHQWLRLRDRADISLDQRAHTGIAALERDAADVALDHVDGEDPVPHPLRRHISAADDEAALAVLRLDGVGDVQDVGESDFLADEVGVERPDLVRREHGRADDGDILELEAQLVDRARHRRAARRLDAEVEGAGWRCRQRPVLPRLGEVGLGRRRHLRGNHGGANH